jgi:UPF0176 protein
MEGCCSTECVTVIHLPEEEQKPSQRELKTEIRFSKGKSDVLTFKTMKKRTVFFVAEKPSKGDPLKKEPKLRKIYIGKGTHFFQNQVLVSFN